MEKRVIMPQRIRGPRHKKKKWYKERGRAGAREREREKENGHITVQPVTKLL